MTGSTPNRRCANDKEYFDIIAMSWHSEFEHSIPERQSARMSKITNYADAVSDVLFLCRRRHATTVTAQSINQSIN